MTEVRTRGTGTVERLADRAGLELGYRGTATVRNEAVAALSTPLAMAKPIFDRAGVEVRSRRLSVHDEWVGKHRSGCVATQSYRLRVTDLAQLDDLLADLIATEPATLAGPQWELSDRASAFSDAQREAVADARTRARGYASALGTRLGSLLRLVDDEEPSTLGYGSFGAHPASLELAQQVERLGLEPELISVTACCTATWTLAEPGPPGSPSSAT